MLRWSHVGGASSYEVCCESQNCGAALNRCNEATVVGGSNENIKTATIENLVSNTLHTFTVRAVCMSANTGDSETSDSSNSIEAATSEYAFIYYSFIHLRKKMVFILVAITLAIWPLKSTNSGCIK